MDYAESRKDSTTDKNLTIDNVWWIKNIKKKRIDLETVSSKRVALEEKIIDISNSIRLKKKSIKNKKEELIKFDLAIKVALFFAPLSLVVSLLATTPSSAVIIWGALMSIDSLVSIYPVLKSKKLKREINILRDSLLNDRVILDDCQDRLDTLNNTEKVIREGEAFVLRELAKNSGKKQEIMTWQYKQDEDELLDKNTEIFVAEKSSAVDRRAPQLVKKYPNK